MSNVEISSFLCLFVCCLIAINPTTEAQGGGCQLRPNKTIDVYRGWPLYIQCTDYMREFDDDYYGEHSVIGCKITNVDTGSVLFNETQDFNKFYDDSSLMENIYTPDLYSNTVYKIQTTFTDLPCWVTMVYLNVTNLPNQTCEQSVKSGVITVKKKFDHRQSAKLTCQSPNEVKNPIKLSASHNFTSYWLYNCSRDLPSETKQTQKGRIFPKIQIDKYSLQHTGLYSCAVEYNGMIQYVIHDDTCVSLTPASGVPEIHCQRNIYDITDLGQNVTIECEADFGAGFVKSVQLNWRRKNDEFTCRHKTGNSPQKATNSTHFCFQKAVNHDLCYKGANDPKVIWKFDTQRATVKLYLYLINVGQSDLGEYTVLVKFRRYTANSSVSVIWTEKRKLESQALYIGLAVGCVVLFLLVIIVSVFILRFYIAAFFKKYFAPCQIDDKQYGAFLSYHFSTEIDKFARGNVTEACSAVRNYLQDRGFSLYDEYRDGNEGFRAEGTVSLMQQCHRVVIVLTAEYVNDNWSRFQLQQGFKQMIECGSKIIFILTPGMREYIKQQSIKDNTYRMIRRALKLNYAISWPCSTMCDSQRFERELEYAMPKLKMFSTTLTPMNGVNGYHPPGVDRLVSNTTVLTTLSPDDNSPTKV